MGNVNNGFFTLSHLLFVDDTIIFCDANRGQIQTLRAILLCFEVVSSLKVNLGKSEMVPVGEVQNINCLAEFLGCKVAAKL